MGNLIAMIHEQRDEVCCTFYNNCVFPIQFPSAIFELIGH